MRTKAEINKTAAQVVNISDYLSLGSHVSEEVVKLTANGEMITTWRLKGATFETEEYVDLNRRCTAINQALLAIGTGQYAVWCHVIRRQFSDSLSTPQKNVFSAGLEAKYNASFTGYAMMLSEIYITLVYRPEGSGKGWFNSVKRITSKEQAKEDQLAAMGALEDGARVLERGLGDFGMQRLGKVTKNGLEVSEQATFYGYLVNGSWQEIPYLPARLKNSLPSSTIYFSKESGLAEIKTNTGKSIFAAFIELQEYPAYTTPSTLDGLLKAPFEFIATHSFSPMAKRAATDWLKLHRNQMYSGGDVAERELEAMDEAIDDVREGGILMGEYHFGLTVFGGTIEQLMLNKSEAVAILGTAGGRAVESRIIPEYCWLAQTPGTWNYRPRKAVITSKNFSNLFALHNYAQGRKTGNPWGEALAILKTESGQPFYFNFHAVAPGEPDRTDQVLPGNTFISGATGAGKTTALGFMLAMAQRYPARVIAFDRGRNNEILIRVMGGLYRSLRLGEPTGINPFQWENTAPNRDLCLRLVKQCVAQNGGSLTTGQHDELAKAVTSVFKLSMNLRRIGSIPQNLTDQDLKTRLRPWCGNGENGWVLDNPENSIDVTSSRIMGFDYTEFIDNPEVRSVLLTVLMAATEQSLDGTPTIVSIDEFWKPLQDDLFAAYAEELARTIRYRNGVVVFSTQSPSDLLKHERARALIEQCSTKIFLPNPNGSLRELVDGYNLGPVEAAKYLEWSKESRKMLLKQDQRTSVARLDLAGMDDEIVALSGNKANLELMDQLMSGHSTDPAIWFPLLLEQIAIRREAKRQYV